MTKRDTYFNKAQELYCTELMPIKTIAEKLNLHPRTLINWGKSGNWKSKRMRFNNDRRSFFLDLCDLCIKLMSSVEKDIALGKKPCQLSLDIISLMIPIVLESEKTGG